MDAADRQSPRRTAKQTTRRQDRDDPRDLLPAALDQKIAVLRAEARDRFPGLELSAFVTIRITDHRRSDTAELIARRGWSGTDVDAVWQMPAILIGSTTQIREDLQARRELIRRRMEEHHRRTENPRRFFGLGRRQPRG